MLLRAVLKCRDPEGPGDAVQPQDLFFIFDNGHMNTPTKVLSCFTNNDGDRVNTQVHKVHLTVDEDSLCNRKSLVRTSVCEQVEVMHIITQKDFSNMGMPHVRRKHFNGSNFGTHLGNMILPSYATLWSESCKSKLELYGKYRVAVGGKTEGEDGPGRGVKRKDRTTIEPVFWHGRPSLLYDEILHSYRLDAIIDLSCGDGQLALTCARNRTPYFGFALTEKHATLLRDHLIEEILKGMVNEADPMFDPQLASIAQSAKKLKPTTALTQKVKASKAKVTPTGSDAAGNAQIVVGESDDEDYNTTDRQTKSGDGSATQVAGSLCNPTLKTFTPCESWQLFAPMLAGWFSAVPLEIDISQHVRPGGQPGRRAQHVQSKIGCHQ